MAFEMNRCEKYDAVRFLCKEYNLCINDLLFYSIAQMIKYNINKTEDIFRMDNKEEYKVVIERVKK